MAQTPFAEGALWSGSCGSGLSGHRAGGPELGPSQADGFLLPEVFPTGCKFVFTYGREKLLMRGLRISRKNNSSVGRPGQEAFANGVLGMIEKSGVHWTQGGNAPWGIKSFHPCCDLHSLDLTPHCPPDLTSNHFPSLCCALATLVFLFLKHVGSFQLSWHMLFPLPGTVLQKSSQGFTLNLTSHLLLREGFSATSQNHPMAPSYEPISVVPNCPD